MSNAPLAPIQLHNLGRTYLRQANRFHLTSAYTERNLEAAKEAFEEAREKEHRA